MEITSDVEYPKEKRLQRLENEQKNALYNKMQIY